MEQEKQGTYIKGYHDLLRPEILALIPQTAKKILDLGCGTGELGKALKKRQACIVNGVEADPFAAKEAEKNLDNIDTHDLNIPRNKKYGAKYDCLVFADILEHLFNPWGTVINECENLSPDGTVIASIPNIAHPDIVKNLTRGLWQYANAGILDITHVRFFTKTSICQLFLKANLKIKNIIPFPSAENPIQYLIVAKPKKSQTTQPKVTLLMLACNALEYTKKAIESIYQHTKIPFQLIVIDNGSTDGTPSHLRKDDRYYHIENQSNLGFPTAMNLGLEFISTPYFAILNNDIIVTDGWLKRMIETIESDPKIAIVGPRSNYVSGPQIDPNAKYSNMDEMHVYARNASNGSFERPKIFHRIVFFCTLLKSQLLTEVGGLDEQFGMGNFEDDDYCRRAIQKGYKCAIDNGVFIHHYGSQTFRANNIDYKKLIEENLKKFKKKWGL